MTVPAAAQPPARLLLGPGPSPVPDAVLDAQARPVVGHLDPWFLQVMDEIAAMLRQVLRTTNRLTFPVSGTGSAGMEAAIVNVVEPGDTVIVGVNGVFGGRLADTARRAGAQVVALEEPWGRVIAPDRVAEALAAHPDARAVVLVHAETSTGAHQPLDEIGALVADTPALLVVDAVTSLGGVPLEVDDWHLDVVYSGTQKCLSVPPGLAPITFSPKAEAVLDARRARCSRGTSTSRRSVGTGTAGTANGPTTTPPRSRPCTACTRACGSSSRRASRLAGTGTVGWGSGCRTPWPTGVGACWRRRATACRS